ncbi:hypothetical protein [Bacterioplanoides pacificum]|uniref:MSHA biogenesis protein MshK n=1 Tax=Bacterioplanoides pacificum TaxID=1171596 RepID=A0ABV7VMH8_9GAMM
MARMFNPLMMALLTLFMAVGVQAADPTRPPAWLQRGTAVAPVLAPRSYVLQQILIQGERRRAVINGRLLQPGDTIDDARVVAVNPTNVTLKTARQQLTISLAGSSAVKLTTTGSKAD